MRMTPPEMIDMAERIGTQFEVPRKVLLPASNPDSKFTSHALAWRADEIAQNDQHCILLQGFPIIEPSHSGGHLCMTIDPMKLAFQFPCEVWVADATVVKGVASTPTSVLNTGALRTELIFMGSMVMGPNSKTYLVSTKPAISMVIPLSALTRPNEAQVAAPGLAGLYQGKTLTAVNMPTSPVELLAAEVPQS